MEELDEAVGLAELGGFWHGQNLHLEVGKFVAWVEEAVSYVRRAEELEVEAAAPRGDDILSPTSVPED